MPDKDEEALRLASVHYKVEPGITKIFRLRGSAEVELKPNEPIKLLEVNEYTIPSGIMPLGFDPLPQQNIHFPSVIVEVTPEEFARIQTKELKLPEGWRIGDLLPKPADNGAE